MGDGGGEVAGGDEGWGVGSGGGAVVGVTPGVGVFATVPDAVAVGVGEPPRVGDSVAVWDVGEPDEVPCSSSVWLGDPVEGFGDVAGEFAGLGVSTTLGDGLDP